MTDLFGAPLIPGLEMQSRFLDESEQRALIEKIDGADLTPFRFQQWTGKRLTQSFGWSYDFQNARLEAGPAFPNWLLPLRDRAAAAVNLYPDALAQALLIRYDPGAGIGWHRDRPIYEHVIGISLGASAEMRFRKREANGWHRTSAALESGELYHLSGEARHDWEHSIAPMKQPRWSITFRSFSVAGRAAAARLHPTVSDRRDPPRPV